jgi:galactose-1-phosphate uridylyltransferase
MDPQMIPPSSYLLRMADGTVKQINPFTGTEVWTVPRRGTRPRNNVGHHGAPIDPARAGAYCAFCSGRMLETPPEKARLVGDGPGRFKLLRDIGAEALFATEPEFRRVPNLFEIVSYDFWAKNFGYTMPDAVRAHKETYLISPAGRRHVLGCIDFRLKLSGLDPSEIEAMPEADKLLMADAFFGGGHELIIAHRHFIDGASHDDQLCSSGGLTPPEHFRYIQFSIDALREIYLANRYVRYVAVFQNWLQPAGASFDHLHKQLVAIDERGAHNELEMRLVRDNPNIYNEAAANFAGYHNLVFAENAHAIAFAGFGHRFPTLEIYSKSRRSEPWNHSAEELRGMSDLVHACHAAMGPTIPCNEEWHYKPPDADTPMPWRILIKWRISNPAGFEGGTYIYVNTIDPHGLREQMVQRLMELRAVGSIAPMEIGDECDCEPNCLKYNPSVRREEHGESAFPPLSRTPSAWP